MSLLNVRLDADDERRAKILRSAGVPISRIVREAIRAEYERRVALPRGETKPSHVVVEILESLPDPPDLAARPFPATDRRAVRRHVVRKLLGGRG